MQNLKIFTNSLLGILLVFAMMLFIKSGDAQCPAECGPNNIATFDHFHNGGSPCGNNANGDATIAAGLNSISDGDVSFTLGEECFTSTSATYALAGGFASGVEAQYGFAYGNQCIVHGGANGAYAGGLRSEAHEPFSWAFGDQSNTESLHSMAFGEEARTSTTANYSLAFGNLAQTNGNHSLAFGNQAETDGAYSFALGDQVETRADYAFAGGFESVTSSPNSFTYGEQCLITPNSHHSFAIGDSATVRDGHHNYSLGNNTLVDNDFGESLLFGSHITLSSSQSFLAGWDNDPVLFAEHQEGVGIFTDQVHTDYDLHIEEGGNFLQNYSGTYPNTTSTANQWAIDGDASPVMAGVLTDGFGKHYQRENYAVDFGLFERQANLYDGAIVFGDYTAADVDNTNWLRFYWRFSTGVDELMRLMPNEPMLNNVLEVYGNAGKPGGGHWNPLSSDRRLKSDIKQYEDGLEEVLQLKPVRYHFNEKSNLDTEPEYVGLIAQDLQEVVPELVIEDEETGYLTYESTPLFFMLINAVQEQQKVIEKQDERITRLEEKYEAVFGAADKDETGDPNEEMNKQQVSLTGESLDRALLYQNEPNPFSNTTTIRYYLPEDTKNAHMVFVSTESGRVLKEVSLKGGGMGSIEVEVSELPSGNYTYTLVINGKHELSRQMILSK